MYKGMKELKKVQLEMLLEVDRLCKEHDIKYQLFAGTLLGAIRHKGFIPWDDDIDICMLREDYNKFLEVCIKGININYFLQNYKTNKNFMHSISRIRKNNTLALQQAWADLDIHHGIFIDIFPLDNILPNNCMGKLQRHILYFLKKVKYIKVKRKLERSRNIFISWLKKIIRIFLIPISLRRINVIIDRLSQLFFKKNTLYATCLTEPDKNSYFDYMIIKEEFHDTIDMEFEGHLFPVPRSYHKVLTNTFGDYMTPPPIEEQKPHHGVIEVCLDTHKRQITV